MSDLRRDLPIGLFDSGVGGLTVLAAMQKVMPDESFIYLGDNARLPYGTKSPQTIVRYALQVADFLVKRKIKLLVVACNTASAIALEALRERYPDLPIVGVVEPGAQAACQASKTGSIAVIATESTIRGQAYHKAIAKINPNAKIVAKACPLFVPMAEEGLVGGELVEKIVEHYLAEMFFQEESAESPDCLVLGCTHFPLLQAAIGRVIGNNVKIVDSANTTALTVKHLICGAESDRVACKPGSKGQVQFLTTDDVKPFVRIGALFLGGSLCAEDVEMVDL